jgi:hypothetical protein
MIRLKPLLTEQLGGKNAVFKQSPIDKTGVVSPFDAKMVAKLIYDSKGYLNDNETLVKNAIIKNIKNINQYAQVNKELQKLTSKRGIGEYLRSFLNNVDRLEIIRSLILVLPQTDWNWTILKIMPYSDFDVVSQSNPSYWDKLVGNVTSGVPVSKTETKLIQLYRPERQRKQKEQQRIAGNVTLELNAINTLINIKLGPLRPLLMKKLPLHLRCFFEFLSGRTTVFTEADLHDDERKFLLNCSLSHGVEYGFNYNYWKSVGATGELSLTKGGAAAEARKNSSKGTMMNMISPSLATSFMYTLGEIAKPNVYKSGVNTIVVKDNYDFNSKEYNMTNDQIIKDFTDTIKSYQKGDATLYHIVRKAANLRELNGYNGFPINFILRYTAPKTITPTPSIKK